MNFHEVTYIHLCREFIHFEFFSDILIYWNFEQLSYVTVWYDSSKYYKPTACGRNVDGREESVNFSTSYFAACEQYAIIRSADIIGRLIM